MPWEAWPECFGEANKSLKALRGNEFREHCERHEGARRAEGPWAVAQSLKFILRVMGSWRTLFSTRVPFDDFSVHEDHALKNPVNQKRRVY